MWWGNWLEYDMATVRMKLVLTDNASVLGGMRGVEV